MKIPEKFFLAVIVLLIYSCPINSNASDYITKTAILTPVADTYVYQFGTTDSPSENELRVGCETIGDTTDNVISLLRFDISEISEISQIKSALLHIYALDIKASREFSSFQTIASLKNWMESDPEYPFETLVDTPVYDSKCITGIAGTSPDLYLWDITDLVQAWIDGKPNYGIVLTADLENSNDYIRFYASESQFYKPCIKIMYEVPKTAFKTDTVNGKDDEFYAGEINNAERTIESADSDSADHIVKDPVSIIEHPVSQSQKAGESITFHVKSTGTGPFSFQWKRNHIDIQGADSESYTLKSVQKEDEGIYSCEVSNEFSNDISDNAKLTVTVLSQGKNPPSPEIKNSEALPENFVNDSEPASSGTESGKVVEVPQEEAVKTLPVDDVPEKMPEPETVFPAEPEKTYPPEILSHPTTQIKNPGDSVTFSVSVSGIPPFKYQWKKDGQNIDGATSQNYTIDAVAENDEGSFSCMVYNDAGSVLSDNARLMANDPVQITSHPGSQTKNPGDSVTFSVSVSGTPPFEYQWKKDGKNIDGATSPNYTIDAVAENDEGSFSCMVYNDAGSVLSDNARLMANDPVQITSHPISQTLKSGESVTFSVSVSGTPPFEYQWKKDDTEIPYAILNSVTLNPVGTEDAGVYLCEVSNEFSFDISNDATLTINDPPGILSHPDSKTKNPGESVTLSVSVSGTPPIEYQWKKDGTDIPYAISDSITLSPLKKNDAGVYSCEVTNKFATAVTNDAVLNITEPSLSTAKESQDSSQQLADKAFSFDLQLFPPSGQEQYVHNGSALTFEGSSVPGVSLVLAHLEDDQGFLIRDISKAVTINTETGHINGAVFVGSFRGALSVRLRIRVFDDLTKKTFNGLSNTLIVDNTDPEITVSAPSDQSTFKSAPIAIDGSAADSISGIAKIEISADGGASYHPVNSFDHGRWHYSFKPKATESTYTIRARATDVSGRSSVSGSRVVHYQTRPGISAPSASIRKTSIQPYSPGDDSHNAIADKSFEEDGICTYRIISLGDNQFQPSDLFTLDEEMAIIVKGYGGEIVTIKLIDPTQEKVVFELSDYIPANKHKMWKWKLSKTGIFKAALFIDGSPRDDVFFKITR